MGVKHGDKIYVISLRGGQFYLGGSTIVDRIVNRDQAIDALGTENLWDGSEHVLSQENSGTPLNLHRRLASEITRKLRFVFKAGPSQLSFISPTELDNQATRGVKELTAESAAFLDDIIECTDRGADYRNLLTVTSEMFDSIERNRKLPESITLPEELGSDSAYVEGAAVSVLVNRYERLKSVRDACIGVHGVNCVACGFSFENFYGQDAAGFIHTHHLKPLAVSGQEHAVDPVHDLVPVCPNCHAMIHLGGQCRTIEEVREIIRRNQKR